MKTPFAIGRTLLAAVFFVSGISKLLNYQATLVLMKDYGMGSPTLLLPIATAIEVGGSLALALGFRVRAVCLLLAAYLIPVTLIFHPFWASTGETRQAQGIEFLKNCSIIGGLYLTATYQRALQSFTGGTLTTLRRETFERRKAA